MAYFTLLFLVGILPFQFALNFWQGFDVSLIRVLIMILCFVWVFDGLKNRKLRVNIGLQGFLVISYLCLVGISLVWAENFPWALRKSFYLLSIFPVYFITGSILDSESKIKQVIKVFIYTSFGASLIGLVQFSLQFVLGLDESVIFWKKIMPFFIGEAFFSAVNQYSSWVVNISGRNFFRAISFFPDPHTFAVFLGMVLPWAVYSFLFFEKKFLYLIISLVILLANLLTFSRGGYVAILIASLFFIYRILLKKFPHSSMFLKNNYIKGKNFFVQIVLILGMIIFGAYLISPVWVRVGDVLNFNDGSIKERISIWKEAVILIEKNPFGVGIGNYAYEIRPSASYRDPIYAHNLYLDVAAETGLLSSFIWVVLLVSSIVKYFSLGRSMAWIESGAYSLIIFSTHSFFELPIYSVQVFPLLLIILAIASLNSKNKV